MNAEEMKLEEARELTAIIAASRKSAAQKK
jgi:hypothetical protein